ncbi:MAG: Ku protein [Chloroflexi bacterium]|nr:Ku protein [Chloroflexota bacterium]MBV9134830.1 Ku protein [Chloroflexota bacterium]MBV9899359.1 Ku protein [Chloroflexota bacterium]
MPRPIWKGAITFGMISIPVKLFGATESKDLAFNTLHKVCKSRLKQKRWCPVDDREVFQDEVVRAYEFTKDNYIEITDEDIESLPVPSKHTIELTSFVKSDEIDPVYFERSYFLEAEQIGGKPYALLMRALKTKDVVAIGKIALRNKESLCALRAGDNALMLETLYYPDEIRTADLQAEPEVLVSPQELTMALSLVEMLEEPFDPKKYHDEYRTAMLEMIEAKANGQEVVAAPETPLPKTVDLMAALKASLEAAKKGKPGAPVATEPEEPQEEVAVAF